MQPTFFEHPILNPPYAYPARHWELDADDRPDFNVCINGRGGEDAVAKADTIATQWVLAMNALASYARWPSPSSAWCMTWKRTSRGSSNANWKMRRTSRRHTRAGTRPQWTSTPSEACWRRGARRDLASPAIR